MISIVICSIDAAKFSAAAASYAHAMGNHVYELIGIHDAQSLCEGYNRGLRQAAGDYIVFSHDDVDLPAPNLGDCIEQHFAKFDVFGVAGTTALAGMGWAHSGLGAARGVITHFRDNALDIQLFGVTDRQMGNVQALDGVWIAARAEVARRIDFDAETFYGWHGYDTDFSFRCHLAGCRVGVVADIPVVHSGKGKVDQSWLLYARRFREKQDANLVASNGTWFDVLMRVGNTSEVLAAYDLDALQAQTDIVCARLEPT